MSALTTDIWNQVKNTKHKDIESALEKDGWVRIKKSGARHIYRHPDRSEDEIISVHCHPSQPMARGTLKRLFADAGWETDEDFYEVGLIRKPKGR